MRRISTLLLVLGFALLLGSGNAVAGDGNFYQWLHDDDGDGIPNCLDPDWYAPEDGTGYQNNNGQLTTSTLPDGTLNGDQIKDQIQLKLQDGSCQDTVVVPTSLDGDMDRLQIQLKLQDGSCNP
ncbi:MAG: hypothetical protein AB1483_03600 [Candidatus Zixiibacteriota bacterium]